jgi:hypothetical protein
MLFVSANLDHSARHQLLVRRAVDHFNNSQLLG